MTLAAAQAIDPFDEAFLADPYAQHGKLRDAGPVVWLQPIRCFGMARHVEVQAALKDHAIFCSARGVGLAGFGIHQYLGQMVARLEAETVLSALIARVAAIRTTGPPVRRLNNTLHALASLPVEIEPA